MLEVPHHEATEGERQPADGCADAVRAEQPSVEVQAQRRDEIVDDAHPDVRRGRVQTEQQRHLDRREQPKLAIRDDRVAAEDQRGPERQAPGPKLACGPGRERIIKRGGVAPVGDRAAAQLTNEECNNKACQRDRRQDGEKCGANGREWARRRAAGRFGAGPTVRGDSQGWAPSSGRRARSNASSAK